MILKVYTNASIVLEKYFVINSGDSFIPFEIHQLTVFTNDEEMWWIK